MFIWFLESFVSSLFKKNNHRIAQKCLIIVGLNYEYSLSQILIWVKSHLSIKSIIPKPLLQNTEGKPPDFWTHGTSLFERVHFFKKIIILSLKKIGTAFPNEWGPTFEKIWHFWGTDDESVVRIVLKKRIKFKKGRDAWFHWG